MPDISYAAISLESISGDLWYSLYHGALVLCVPFNSFLRITFGKKKKSNLSQTSQTGFVPKKIFTNHLGYRFWEFFKTFLWMHPQNVSF